MVVQIHCHRLRLNYTIHTLRLIQYTTAVILHTVKTKVLASPHTLGCELSWKIFSIDSDCYTGGSVELRRDAVVSASHAAAAN